MLHTSSKASRLGIKKQKTSFKSSSINLGNIKRQILVVSVLLLNLFWFLALFSYSSLDRCLNVAGEQKVSNLVGYFGAVVSDLALQYFGISAWIVCFVLLFWTIDLILGREKFQFALRAIGGMLAIIACSLLVGFGKSYNFSMQMLPGGYVGFTYASVLRDKLGVIGGILICLFSLIFGLCLALSIGTAKPSWWFFVKSIGKGRILIRSFKFIWSVLGLFFQSFFRFFRRFFILLNRVFSLGQNYAEFSQKIAVNTKNTHNSGGFFDKTTESISHSAGSSNKFRMQDRSDEYIPPRIELLSKPSLKKIQIDDFVIEESKKRLMSVLSEFGVRGVVVQCGFGPVITLYKIRLEPGTKASRVIGLANDVARTMHVSAIRIADIPSCGVIGVEIPNAERQSLTLREIFMSSEYSSARHNIPIVLGVDISGKPVVSDLSKMPHLLIAGTTGSGKSVGLNAMIVSMLYKLSPDECKFVMIDPKMLELSLYDGIPHLLSPAITDPTEAIVAMKWVVEEMMNRNRKMSNLSVRNISSYNQKAAMAKMRGSKIVRNIEVCDPVTGKIVTEKIEEEAKEMPYIVVIIDEMADLMMVAGKEMEGLIQRITQMARAAGIHLIMATQRPSVDVITGVIKANLSTRISYRVASRTDSRIIIEEQGAEQLLGHGDMLYLELGKKPQRVHGPFVSEEEVEMITKDLRSRYKPSYVDILTQSLDDKNKLAESSDLTSGNSQKDDEGIAMYRKAISIVVNDKKTSISYLQRRMRIGYNKAANFIEQMESDGILSEPDNSGKRKLLKESLD